MGRPQLLQACGPLPFDLLIEDCFSPSSSEGSRGSTGSSEDAGPAPAAAVDVRSHAFPGEDTLIIFDWDDTLMPTTWLKTQGLSVHSRRSDVEQRREELDRIAAAARGSLLAAKRLGHVAVVTNAERGWIEMSCGLFLPALQAELEGVRLVSARSTYESWQHRQPHEWKTLAFCDELRLAFGDDLASGAAVGRKANVLSLGDSLDERRALMTSTAELPSCRRKSLKFVDDPDPAQLCEQHRLVSSNLERIVQQDCELDLKILCE